MNVSETKHNKKQSSDTLCAEDCLLVDLSGIEPLASAIADDRNGGLCQCAAVPNVHVNHSTNGQ